MEEKKITKANNTKESKKTVTKTTNIKKTSKKVTPKVSNKENTKGESKKVSTKKVPIKKVDIVKENEQKKVAETTKVAVENKTNSSKKMKEETKKSLLLICFAAVFVFLIIGIGISEGKKSEKMYEKFQTALSSTQATLVYIGRPTCTYCKLLTPSLEEMASRYNFNYVYINTDEMRSNYMNKIMSDLNLTEIGTPYLTIVKNNEVVDTQNGYADYDKSFEFLKKNSIINEDAVLPINYIGLEQYKTLLAGTTPSIVVVGQSTCSYCINTKLVLNKLVDDYGTKINYLNVSYLTEEEGKELESSLPYFTENEWGTPVTLIVKDNTLVANLDGYNSESAFVSFFTEQGVLK